MFIFTDFIFEWRGSNLILRFDHLASVRLSFKFIFIFMDTCCIKIKANLSERNYERKYPPEGNL
ncbi:MAG: hypothetical protein CVU51_01735 [Deltaproteobacteria bacterium HGW-Deltaproteobacteria-1]|nr:MAG: hypothetical protein CVU51_01735 [Deltaproteobacteria bacterium HGW-Deltaproteobacteria-1]